MPVLNEIATEIISNFSWQLLHSFRKEGSINGYCVQVIHIIEEE